jgi:hypothetical protein
VVENPSVGFGQALLLQPISELRVSLLDEFGELDSPTCPRQQPNHDSFWLRSPGEPPLRGFYFSIALQEIT